MEADPLDDHCVAIGNRDLMHHLPVHILEVEESEFELWWKCATRVTPIGYTRAIRYFCATKLLVKRPEEVAG